ncbi:MAG: T9SS C-terminal target domain-containing protein [Cytophagales bacterium]|nr:MAG: T9SS C-terminal target domain-containing protein [Cytophagales bacterium]
MTKQILFFSLFMSIFYSSFALVLPKDKARNSAYAPMLAASSSAISHIVYYSDDKLYSSTQIEISNIYPNPANDIVKFNYTLLEPMLKAKITIRNVLGSVIAEEELSHETKQLDIHVNEYTAGMYFYTLSINNKSIITKKFLVKR